MNVSFGGWTGHFDLLHDLPPPFGFNFTLVEFKSFVRATMDIYSNTRLIVTMCKSFVLVWILKYNYTRLTIDVVIGIIIFEFFK